MILKPAYKPGDFLQNGTHLITLFSPAFTPRDRKASIDQDLNHRGFTGVYEHSVTFSPFRDLTTNNTLSHRSEPKDSNPRGFTGVSERFKTEITQE